MEKQNSRKNWNRIALKYGKSYISNSIFFNYKKSQLFLLMKRWHVQIRGKKVLLTDLFDEAFNEGNFQELKSVKELWAIDISEEVVRFAQENAKSNNVNLISKRCDVNKICFSSSKFDIVISNSTLDHLPELGTALKEINRVLKPGGKLVITLVNKKNPGFRLLLSVERILSKGVYSEAFFSHEDLRLELEKAGFRIKRQGFLMFAPVASRTLFNLLGDKSKLSKALCNQLVRFFLFLERLRLNCCALLIAEEAIKE